MSKYHFGSIVDRYFRNTLQRLADDAAVQGKAIQDLVAEGQLTEEQYAELITTINGHLKSGQIDKSDLSLEFKGEIEEFNAQLAQKATKQEVEVERLRINSLSQLEEGSTTGDAELMDIRIGIDGTVYETAGEAVRNLLTPFMASEGEDF